MHKDRSPVVCKTIEILLNKAMNLFGIKKRAIFILLCISIAAIVVNNLEAENIEHILISEIQISGESTNDEFIELYNPTGADIDLKEWDLKKITGNGSVQNIVTNIEGIIPASGYFLIVPRAKCGETGSESCYKGTVEKDAEYTTGNYLAKDNAILLYDRNGNLVDKVGWGAAIEFEGEAFGNNPENSQSLERKVDAGIMRDTDNNKDDFILQVAPTPKNTKSVLQNIGDSGSGPEGGQTNDQNQESANENNGTQNNGSPGGSSSSSSGSYAQNYSAKIIITEFLPNPEDNDTDNEFIEVYNAGSQDENIGGWTMDDKLGKTRSYSIPENTIIRVGEYKVFTSSETRIVLNNSGDGIVLKNRNGETINETPTSGAASEDVSYALKDDGIWAWTKRPTPGTKNIIEIEEKEKTKVETINANKTEDALEETINYDYSDGIIITELLPDPEGSDNKLNYEWIEIYNDSDKEVDLRGWMIDDIQNKGSKPYVIKDGRKVKPQGYEVFSKEETSVILNNTEDEVNIVWPDGTVVDSINYKKPKEGFSYVLLKNGLWDWASKPSPGKENVISNESESEKKDKAAQQILSRNLNIEEDPAFWEEDAGYVLGENTMEFVETDVEGAKKLPRFSNVKISGIVSVAPGSFEDDMFYISGSGLQIFSYSRIFGGISLGDKIELFGKMSEVGGEKRLIVENPDYLKIISHDNLLEPKMISTGDVGEKYEGYLVLAEGSVAAISGDIFYIDDGSGQAKIYIKPQTGIKKPEMKIGETANITGIISRTSLGYRVLPRFQNDIRIGRTSSVSLSEGEAQVAPAKQIGGKKDDNIPLYYYGFLMAGLIVLIDWGRMKAKK